MSTTAPVKSLQAATKSKSKAEEFSLEGANQSVSLADLALHFARYRLGDTSATQYFTGKGIHLRTKIDEPVIQSETTDRNPAKQTEAALTTTPSPVDTPKKPDFDFPIFCVTGKVTKQPHEQDALTGMAYDNSMEDSNALIPEKLPPEPLQQTLGKLIPQLSTFEPGKRIAIKQLVTKAAQHQVVAQLPVIETPHTPDKLWVLIDKSAVLSGFEQDAFQLADALNTALPVSKISTLVFPHGPFNPWGYRDGQLQFGSVPMPDANSSVLLIAGLNKASVPGWHSWIRRIQKKGNNLLWLTPDLPGHELHQQCDFPWLLWGQSKNISGRSLGLLLALTMTMRIVPGSLLRRLVKHLAMPAYFESRFYQLPEVTYYQGADYCQIKIEENLRKVQLKQILNQLSCDEIKPISNIIQLFLEPISQSVWHEHRIALHLTCEQYQCDDIQTSYDFFTSMGVSLKQKSPNQQGIALFLADSAQRFGEDIKGADIALQQTLGRACKYLTDNKIKDKIPESLAQIALAPEPGAEANSTKLALVQRGHDLILVKSEKLTENPLSSNVVAEITVVEKEPLFLQEMDINGRPMSDLQAIGRELPEKLPKDFILHSQFESLSISRRTSKDFWWATRLSTSANGLVAESEHIKAVWLKHGPVNLDLGMSISGNSHHPRGSLIGVKHNSPKWLQEQAIHLDSVGPFMTYKVKKVKFNLRYIPPGSFLMGSPQDEPERYDDETLHPVTLTQGFWIGETTVTQQLWQAVMGDNPSHFQAQDNEELPVEQVSWHDCQTFCEKLSELTGAKFSLPTEAQWEYACRAGTTAPFNTGEQLGYEQGNYDINYPYEGREALVLQSGEKYRQKTVDVNCFEANHWGLKQMPGNVFEWCQDDWREAISGHQVDPCATGDTAAFAVLRGGSWNDYGRVCRSAYRSHFGRDFRNYLIGLRVTQVMPGTSQKKQEQILTESASKNV